jgi:hyperosmotically inducible protein
MEEEEAIMNKTIQKVSLAVAFAFLTVPMFGRANNPPADMNDAVRHALVMLPYFSVFDDLGYRVDNGVVTLSGDVTRPVLKSDAEHAVKGIPGVAQVVNEIKVLPLSSFDNQIRRAEYHAIFNFGGLYRYALGANPSIHIIVDNGHVTLVGVVDNEGDKNLANIRANGVSGVFSVTNNLRVAEKS